MLGLVKASNARSHSTSRNLRREGRCERCCLARLGSCLGDDLASVVDILTGVVDQVASGVVCNTGTFLHVLRTRCCM